MILQPFAGRRLLNQLPVLPKPPVRTPPTASLSVFDICRITLGNAVSFFDTYRLKTMIEYGNHNMAFIARIVIIISVNYALTVNQTQGIFNRQTRPDVNSKKFIRQHVGFYACRNQSNSLWQKRYIFRSWLCQLAGAASGFSFRQNYFGTYKTTDYFKSPNTHTNPPSVLLRNMRQRFLLNWPKGRKAKVILLEHSC